MEYLVIIHLGVAIPTLKDDDTDNRLKKVLLYGNQKLVFCELKHTRGPTLEGVVYTSQVGNLFDLSRR